MSNPLYQLSTNPELVSLNTVKMLSCLLMKKGIHSLYSCDILILLFSPFFKIEEVTSYWYISTLENNKKFFVITIQTKIKVI